MNDKPTRDHLASDASRDRFDTIVKLVREGAEEAAIEAILDVVGELEMLADSQPTGIDRSALDERLNALTTACFKRIYDSSPAAFQKMMVAKARVHELFRTYNGPERRVEFERRALMDIDVFNKLTHAAEKAKGPHSPVVMEKADITALLVAVLPVAEARLPAMTPAEAEEFREKWMALADHGTISSVDGDMGERRLVVSDAELTRMQADRAALAAAGYDSVEALLADYAAVKSRAAAED